MITYKFDKDNVETMEFELIPVGKHKLRIASMEEDVSSNGHQMIIFYFDVSGHKGRIRHNLTFLEDRPGLTNGFIRAISDSFGVTPGDFLPASWIGKVGAGHVKHRDGYANISYFIAKCKQENLGNWVEIKENGVPY